MCFCLDPLLAVIRFRKKSFTVTANIQQVFFASLSTKNKDVLHFFWYRDNFASPCVWQLPSSAVSIYGQGRAARDFDSDICHFIETDFVDNITSNGRSDC